MAFRLVRGIFVCLHAFIPNIGNNFMKYAGTTHAKTKWKDRERERKKYEIAKNVYGKCLVKLPNTVRGSRNWYVFRDSTIQ